MRRLLPSFGIPGVAACAVLAFALWSAKATLEPLEAEQARLAAALEVGRKADPAARMVASGPMGPRERVDAVYRFLDRNGGTVEDALAELYALAEALNLPFRSADYKLTSFAGSTLSAYTIRLPMTGTYAQVRAYVENVLQQMPSVALERIDFKRPAPSSPRVEATVEVTLFVTRL